MVSEIFVKTEKEKETFEILTVEVLKYTHTKA